MLPRRTPTGTRSRLARGLPALVLGLSALALAVPTTVPASAAPAEPKPSTRATKVAGGSQHLTSAARAAGLEVGNATMGWRERGPERTLLRERSFVSPRGAAVAGTTDDSFTPKGVLGVDVSSYQRNITWATWTKQSKKFAYVKATEGSSYTNPYFKNQYGGAKKAGLIRGAYHFANPAGKAGYLQARWFVKHGGGWSADGQTLPGVLDIEYNPYGSTCYGVSKKKMVAWISSFTREYKKLTGKDAVIYSTTDWWRRCTGNTATLAATNPLWVARYGTEKPGVLPQGWKTATFWQYSADPIDSDVFPKKLKALKALATVKDQPTT